MFIYETEVAEDEKQPENIDEENEEDNEGPFREPSSSLRIPSGHEELRRQSTKNRDSKIQVRTTISIKKPGQTIKNQNTQYMAEL